MASLQNDLVRQQVRNCIAPFSPFWRGRFAELKRTPSSVRSVADLATLPALGERDVSPSGDPAAMSALVLQAGEATTHRAHRRPADADMRSTSYVFAGHGFRFLVASTRNDLDVVAQAGARLWAVLGLTSDDVLISAVPPAATTEHLALQGAALGAGAPAIFPGESSTAVAAAVRLAPPTVLAVLAATAPQVLSGLTDLASVRTLLLVGAPSDAERLAAAHALSAAGGRSGAAILAVHAPSGARVLWGECRQSGGTTGLHTYPDLDVVQLVDPDSGGPTSAGGEVVLTQLGLRGSALLRWRTADVAAGVTSSVCPSCGRMVPRVEGARRAALIARLDSACTLDLRSIAGVLSARPEIEDWRIVVLRRRRDGALSVVVHYTGTGPANPDAVIAIATDMRAAAGSVPTQLIAADPSELAALGAPGALGALGGRPLSARILLG